jgi:hypothetical protein
MKVKITGASNGMEEIWQLTILWNYSTLVTIIVETMSISETSVNFYETTRRSIKKTVIFTLATLTA